MKTVQMPILVAVVATVAALGVAAGYWLHATTVTPVASASPSQTTMAPPPARKPLYYQDPGGKPDYSPTPKKTADGRDYKPIYDESTASNVATHARASAPTGKGKILYYRNPMGLADTSPVPKKDSMGMDYIPVYEGEDETGVVSVSPARVQMLGVRTAPVEQRASLARVIRATGAIQADESKMATVSTKYDVVVEKMFVATTGTQVHAGQPLARVWIDTPDTMMQRGPDVITRQIDYVVALQDKDPVRIAETESVLRQYGIPGSAIAEIRRTGRATREITLSAPRSGAILEKPAIEGMRINTGDPLFKIADLSSIWVLADVQEQNLGQIQIGEKAEVGLVAFPGRTFVGTIDFIYPTLMASTRTGRVRIVLQNPDGLLRESMYASVAINAPAASGGAVLAVPDSAIIDSGAQQVVLVAKGQGRFEPRGVRIGARGDGATQVLSGLKAGEQVVVSANFLIDAESNLRAALQSFASGGTKNTNAKPGGATP